MKHESNDKANHAGETDAKGSLPPARNWLQFRLNEGIEVEAIILKLGWRRLDTPILPPRLSYCGAPYEVILQIQ
jgi:hypothetical protein